MASIAAPVLAGAQPEQPRRESWSMSKALSRSFRGGSFSRGSFHAGSFRIGSFRVRRPPGPCVEEEARRAEPSMKSDLASKCCCGCLCPLRS